MRQDLRVFAAVAITSFIVVYVCTIVLDKTYSYKIEAKQNIASSNEFKKVNKESKEQEEISIDETESESKEQEKNSIDKTESESNQNVINQQESDTVEDENSISLGQQVVNFAIQYVGYPYVMGGNSLTNGTDCSGFIKLVYENFGILLPRTPYEQSIYGNSVDINNRMPGDIVTYGYSGSVSHSALYIGEDRVVHAATPSQGIIYSNLYMMPIISIRRVI